MNVGQIKTALQDLGYGSDLADQQLRAINAVNRRVEGHRRWPWQEATDGSGAIAVGAYQLTGLPSDLLHVDTLRIENGTDYLDLDWERPQEVRRQLHLDRDNGAPEIWSNWDGGLIVYPRADLAYTVTLDYIKDPTDLDDDTDTPAAPATYHDLYVWGAAAYLAFRERDWYFINVAKGEFRERLQEMEEELGVRQRQTARSVVRSDFWSDL